MARRCSSGFVLSVLIILLTLECAECDQGNLGTESEKDLLLQSDVKFLFGRKMLELDGKPFYMAERSKSAADNSFPEVQTENNHVQAQLHHFQESTFNVAKHDDSTNKKADESKALLEAADEVANLMRKDYRGMARRKPPINNHVPKG